MKCNAAAEALMSVANQHEHLFIASDPAWSVLRNLFNRNVENDQMCREITSLEPTARTRVISCLMSGIRIASRLEFPQRVERYEALGLPRPARSTVSAESKCFCT